MGWERAVGRAIGAALCVLLATGAVARADSALVQRAAQAQAKGNHSEAIALYTQALKDGSLSAKERRAAYVGRGVARGTSGDFGGALNDFNEAVALDPTLSDAYFDRALVRSDIGDYDGSLRDLNMIESVASAYPRYYYYRGYVHYVNRDYDQAIADLTTAATTQTPDAEVFYYRARAYDAEGQREQAMADFGATIRLNPDQTTLLAAYRWRGTEAFALQRYQEAAADFDTVLRLSPSDADAAMRRAYLYFVQGHYSQVVAYASRVIHADAPIEQGTVYPWPGAVDATECFNDGVIEQYNHGIRSQGVDPFALVTRARANLKLGHKDAALADYAVALRAIPPGANASIAAEMAAARQ